MEEWLNVDMVDEIAGMMNCAEQSTVYLILLMNSDWSEMVHSRSTVRKDS